MPAIDHLPPRLSAKALFEKIKEAVEDKGFSLRNQNILDRLYGAGNLEPTLKALRLDCAKHGMKAFIIPTVQIMFVAKGPVSIDDDRIDVVPNAESFRLAG